MSLDNLISTTIFKDGRYVQIWFNNYLVSSIEIIVDHKTKDTIGYMTKDRKFFVNREEAVIQELGRKLDDRKKLNVDLMEIRTICMKLSSYPFASLGNGTAYSEGITINHHDFNETKEGMFGCWPDRKKTDIIILQNNSRWWVAYMDFRVDYFILMPPYTKNEYNSKMVSHLL